MVDAEVPHARGPVDVDVRVPGSKSLTNRALVCAALADGESVIHRSAPGDDTAAMVDGLTALGIGVDVTGEVATVLGTRGQLRPGPLVLSARLAGTTSRFLTAVCALGPGPYEVDGDPPLRRRPMGPLQDALRAIGAHVDAPDGPGSLPVRLTGAARGGSVVVPGDVSSQYLTALMLVAPLLPVGIDISISTPLVSRPYVELTVDVMRAFGHDDVTVDVDRIRVRPGGYRPTTYHVEPDASSASYPLALAAVVGGRVTVDGLGRGARQGDARFADLLAAMGCDVVRDADSLTVTGPTDQALVGVDVDMADISDLVPTMAVVAAVAGSPSRISGVGFVRGKESDRLGDLATELRKAGVAIDVEPDGLLVQPSAATLGPARLATHHDHRLAMAFGVLGARVGGMVVDDPSVVTKSWPDFWVQLHHWVGAA